MTPLSLETMTDQKHANVSMGNDFVSMFVGDHLMVD